MARNKLARRCKKCQASFDPGDYWRLFHSKSADVASNMTRNPRWCPTCNLLKEYRKPMPANFMQWNVAWQGRFASHGAGRKSHIKGGTIRHR